jgi:hypothetical protein
VVDKPLTRYIIEGISLRIELPPLRSEVKGRSDRTTSNGLILIQQDIIPSIFFRFDSPRHWDKPQVVVFEPELVDIESVRNVFDFWEKQRELEQEPKEGSSEPYVSVPREDGALFIERSVKVIPDILQGVAVFMEPLENSYLGQETVGSTYSETAFAVTVLKSGRYVHSEIEHERKVNIKDGYSGVVPRNSASILFQGVMIDAQHSIFEYVPVDFVTGKRIVDEELIEAQIKNAEKYLTKPHPKDSRTTPFGMLVSIGVTPHN